MNKKAQGQIITTILIILLVLAAIVIVWQVVNRTVTEGGEEITAQAGCLGFTVAIADKAAGATTVSGVPSKKVTDMTFYVVDGSYALGAAVEAGDSSGPVTVPALVKGDKITASGVVDGQLCQGMNEVIVSE